MAELNLAALEAEIKALTPEEIQKQLLEVRTKQRVQQKKYHNTEASKNYRLKRTAEIKAMTDKAKSLPSPDPKFKSLYDFIRNQANEAATAQLAKADAEEVDAIEGEDNDESDAA